METKVQKYFNFLYFFQKFINSVLKSKGIKRIKSDLEVLKIYGSRCDSTVEFNKK